MSPAIILPDVTEEEYNASGSKFVTFPAGTKTGDIQCRKIEIGMLDWDTPGQSMKVPITVLDEGPDEGKEDKLSFGVLATGIWKGKEIYRAITGGNMPMKTGSDGKNHPAPNPEDLAGKTAYGIWVMQEGKKGGVGETVTYPKLTSISAEPVQTEGLGI